MAWVNVYKITNGAIFALYRAPFDEKIVVSLKKERKRNQVNKIL